MTTSLGKLKKIMKFLVYTYISQNSAQSQLNVAPSHDGETVTFRNSACGVHSVWRLECVQCRACRVKKCIECAECEESEECEECDYCF